MPAIEVESLEKTWPGPVAAVRGIDFSVARGEIFGLLGPNGAGKSSTVRILATLSRPTGGRARVGGHDILADPAAVRRRIGYVGQGSAVDELLDGRENLVIQGRLFGLGGAALTRRVDELLALLDLEDAADRPVRGWSGGMRRRLDLASGIVHRPRILFLDEPSAGLDPESRATLWREVRRLVEEDGMTVLLTTHYLEEADRHAGHVAIIDRGRIMAEGTPDALKGRLEGDLVTVRFAGDTDLAAASARLGGLGEVREILSEGHGLHVRVETGARAVAGLVGALAGFAIEEVTISRPTLDDVYLAVAGRQFDEADAAGAAGAGHGRANGRRARP